MNLPIGSQKIKNRFGIYNCDSPKQNEKLKEQVQGLNWVFFGRFFHGNCQFFKDFEITGTNSSFILKYLKNWNQFFF
jgi:hypothetical protein